MGFKVGLPIMKCSMNPSNQINNKTGKKSKTCSIDKAWKEMNDERLSRDLTIDKSMTSKNVWMIGSTNDDLIGIVNKEIEMINNKRIEVGSRSLRKDAVSMIQIVEKPPIAFMSQLSYEDQVEFLTKSHEIVSELIHDWNPNWKIVEAVQHHDEFGGLSPHTHTMVMVNSFDDKGLPTFRAKDEVNLKFFNYINKNYAPRIREAGYDIEDCITYDMLSDEEKELRRNNPIEYGVDAYVFKEKKRRETLDEIEKLETQKNELNKTIKEIVEYTKSPSIETYKELQDENNELKREIKYKDSLIDKLQQQVEQWKQQAIEFSERFIDVSKKLGSKLLNIFGYQMKDQNIPEYPSSDLIRGYNSLTNSLSDINSKYIRVIPDESTETYSVVYRNNNGEYEDIKSGFKTREEAEDFKRHYKKFNSNFDLGIDYDLNISIKR